MARDPNPVPEEYRRLICGPDRSPDYRRGHRAALRAAIAFLHAEAERMNDPAARARLNGAAHALGCALDWQKRIEGRPPPPET